MGASCVAAALEELADAGAKAVVRVGTCGALQPDIFQGQIIIASGCVRGEGASYELVPPEYPAVPDPLLVCALMEAAKELGEPVKIGLYRSHDAFYMESKAAHPGLRERMEQWIQGGVQVVENESGTLFPYGYLLGLRTGCICVAASNMFADPKEQGQNPFGDTGDPDFMPRRIERAARIAIRAAELLQEDLV
jgi:uridine phosphorylase